MINHHYHLSQTIKTCCGVGLHSRYLLWQRDEEVRVQGSSTKLVA